MNFCKCRIRLNPFPLQKLWVLYVLLAKNFIQFGNFSTKWVTFSVTQVRVLFIDTWGNVEASYDIRNFYWIPATTGGNFTTYTATVKQQQKMQISCKPKCSTTQVIHFQVWCPLLCTTLKFKYIISHKFKSSPKHFSKVTL